MTPRSRRRLAVAGLNLLWIAVAMLLFTTISNGHSGSVAHDCTPPQPASFFFDPILRADVSRPHCETPPAP